MRGIAMFFRLLFRAEPLKIVIGSEGFALKGWMPTDKDDFDITEEKDFSKYFRKQEVSAMLAEHVWEHLTPGDAVVALKNCYEYLKPKGHLRIAVPDGLHPGKDYIARVKPGGTGAGAWDHKVLYTYKDLCNLLSKSGFTVRVLEHWDENGEFHKKDWSIEDGFVKRSFGFDPRNWNGFPNYTSLIVDGIKTN